MVLAAKVRGRTGPGPNQVGLSRSHIIEALEASLKRLGTDYVDVTEEDKRALDEVSKLAPEDPAWMDVLGSDRRPGETRY